MIYKYLYIYIYIYICILYIYIYIFWGIFGLAEALFDLQSVKQLTNIETHPTADSSSSFYIIYIYIYIYMPLNMCQIMQGITGHNRLFFVMPSKSYRA